MTITTTVPEYTGVVPDRAQPEAEFETNVPNFLNHMDSLSAPINTWATEANALAVTVNQYKLDAESAATAAQNASGLANYKGVWSAGTTYAQGESVLYVDTYFVSDINGNIGNTPADDTNWSSIASLDQLNLKADLAGANFTGSIGEGSSTITSTTNVLTIDCSAANNFEHTLTENTTITFTNVPANGVAFAVALKIIQDAGASGFVLSYPSGGKWGEATAPTLAATASGSDVLVFTTTNGFTNWDGYHAGKNLGAAV